MADKPIRKAVFPVAGLGTRFLPATKACPKEMLPVVDKPLIQYAAEEAAAAGITELVFVTSTGKHAIEDHFDTNVELELVLGSKGKYDLLEMVRNILPSGVCCVYVRQPEALGLGHAVACAAPVVANEPFAVVLADDLIAASQPCLTQMVEVYRENSCSVVGVEAIDPVDSRKYGIVDSEPVHGPLSKVRGIVEKPDPASAPSNLGVVGRYILTPRVFQELEHVGKGAGGEVQLTDAIDRLQGEEPVLAFEFEGKRYDCGDKLGYLQANVEYGLNHPELGEAFRIYLEATRA